MAEEKKKPAPKKEGKAEAAAELLLHTERGAFAQ